MKLRILTHIDMDGVCCAALFLRKYGSKIEITYSTVTQALRTVTSGVSFDYVCDLPKVGNAVNLDHHKSNFESLLARNRLSPRDVVDPQSTSATEVVYNYLGFDNDTIAGEIRTLGNLADTARLPEKFRPLDMVLSVFVDDPISLRHISTLLATHGDEILTSSWLVERHNGVREEFERTHYVIQEFLNRAPKLAPILILDTRDSIPGKLAKEVIKPIFDLGVAVIGVVYRKSPEEPLRVSFRVTKTKQENYDVSLTAKAFGGGGHRMAAACSPKATDIPENLKFELQKIARSGDLVQYLKLADV